MLEADANINNGPRRSKDAHLVSCPKLHGKEEASTVQTTLDTF